MMISGLQKRRNRRATFGAGLSSYPYLRRACPDSRDMMTRALATPISILFAAAWVLAAPAPAGRQSDLDAFMSQVLARRDDNWRKLQQYVLDERERLLFTGPGGVRLWGDDRTYTWYIRDGFF